MVVQVLSIHPQHRGRVLQLEKIRMYYINNRTRQPTNKAKYVQSMPTFSSGSFCLSEVINVFHEHTPELDGNSVARYDITFCFVLYDK